MLLDGSIEARARAIGMLGTRPDARTTMMHGITDI
jgi:hypothetical protein